MCLWTCANLATRPRRRGRFGRMSEHVILVRQPSRLRGITESEAVEVLSENDKGQERTHYEVPTDQFAEAVDQGDWYGQDSFLREQALKIRQRADEAGNAQIHYLGLAEVPHVIALGAHLGSERAIVPHDHDRDRGKWNWPEAARTIQLEVNGLEGVERILKASGPAVIRIAISAVISDADVREAVGDQTLADVTITHQTPTIPAVSLVRSLADVESVRLEFRRVFAAIQNSCPNLEVVHLFVAAPPSVCLVVGQELVLRNSCPVQTFRFRKSEDGPDQRPAILLNSSGEEQVLQPLSEEELKAVANVRAALWPSALADIETYCANKQADSVDGRHWIDGHVASSALAKAKCFTDLPALGKLIRSKAAVDPKPFVGDYGYEQDSRLWRLGDRLLAGLSSATESDDDLLRQLIRLFLFHEYLHLHQGLTKHTADEVGKFANCLEYLDYRADSYAILHQWDLMRYSDTRLLPTNLDDVRTFIVGQVELAIRSFWAFDVAAGNEWQVRRIRRYLNWYWRLTQLSHAESIDAIVLLLSRQPRVELGGVSQIARGRRVIALLDQTDPTTQLELAVVLENDRLQRVPNSPSSSLPALLRAFRDGEHEAIKQFFRGVYDLAAATGGVQPHVI